MHNKAAEIARQHQKAKLRDAMIALKEADPVHWKIFFTQFMKDTNVIPQRFYADKERAYQADHSRRIGWTYLSLIAGEDPQILINRLEEAQLDN